MYVSILFQVGVSQIHSVARKFKSGGPARPENFTCGNFLEGRDGHGRRATRAGPCRMAHGGVFCTGRSGPPGRLSTSGPAYPGVFGPSSRAQFLGRAEPGRFFVGPADLDFHTTLVQCLARLLHQLCMLQMHFNLPLRFAYWSLFSFSLSMQHCEDN